MKEEAMHNLSTMIEEYSAPGIAVLCVEPKCFTEAINSIYCLKFDYEYGCINNLIDTVGDIPEKMFVIVDKYCNLNYWQTSSNPIRRLVRIGTEKEKTFVVLIPCSPNRIISQLSYSANLIASVTEYDDNVLKVTSHKCRAGEFDPFYTNMHFNW